MTEKTATEFAKDFAAACTYRKLAATGTVGYDDCTEVVPVSEFSSKKISVRRWWAEYQETYKNRTMTVRYHLYSEKLQEVRK